ncbi:hypothetical protein B296_00039692, partial [Ensete ventricosum]
GLDNDNNGISVPESLIFFITYHTATSHHVVVVLAVRRAPVGCTTADPSMPVSGWLPRVGSAILAGQLSEGARTWQPGQYLPYHFPPEKTFSRFPIRVLKMRSCAGPSVCVNSGTNPGNLVERVNSGTNPGDLTEKVNSGTNPGDLTEKVNSGTNLGNLAENVNSGTNPRDLIERVNLGTNSTDLAEKVNSSTNPEDLAEKVNSSINPGDLAERVHRMDLGDLRGMPKMSSGKAPSTRAAMPAQEVGVSPAREAPKTSSKRLIDAPTEQADDPARRHKKVKVLTRRHKSRHDEGESRSYSKGKEPAASSEEPDTPAESDEGDASLVHHRLRSMKDLFKTKVHKGDAGYYTLQSLERRPDGGG